MSNIVFASDFAIDVIDAITFDVGAAIVSIVANAVTAVVVHLLVLPSLLLLIKLLLQLDC